MTPAQKINPYQQAEPLSTCRQLPRSQPATEQRPPAQRPDFRFRIPGPLPDKQQSPEPNRPPAFPIPALTLCPLLRTGGQCPSGLPGGQSRAAILRGTNQHPSHPPKSSAETYRDSVLHRLVCPSGKFTRAQKTLQGSDLAPHLRVLSLPETPDPCPPIKKGDQKAPGLRLGGKLCFLGSRPEPGATANPGGDSLGVWGLRRQNSPPS